MADEERQDENAESTPQEPEEDQPSQEPSAEEPPAPEEEPQPEAAADQPEATAEQPEAEPPAEEVVAPEEPAAEPSADEVAEAPAEQATEQAPAAPQDAPAQPAKKGDVVPGAELEPIAIEPERELDAEERARLEAEEEERARREAEAEAGDEPLARRGPRAEIPADKLIQATGKRKNSIARVILRPGKGGIEVNSRSLEEYFPRQNLQTMVRQPLLVAGYEDDVTVRVRVHGGGVSGQAGAVRHGIAKALTEVDPELRGELKRRGYLTRDARIKERRKAGLKKARKRPQFSKR